MNSDPLDDITLLLRQELSDVGDVEAMPERRDEAITRLAGAISARGRARRRGRVLGALAVAAAAVTIVGGAAYGLRRGAHTETQTADLARVGDGQGMTLLQGGAPIAPDGRVPEGAELRTAAGSEARLDFDSGTSVTIGGGARVRLVEQRKAKRFALESGSVFAKVAKLHQDERFVVATADAEVEVRGTAFRVSLVSPDPGCGGGTPTRLEVSEGVVVVRHAGAEVRVPAGDAWPHCAAPVAVAPPKVEPRPSHAASHAAPAPASHLAEQNDLFDAALRDKREGRGRAAVAKLDALLTKHPHGPLAESASLERMRVLATTDRARAVTAAREYLRRWPKGSAREEARALADGP
jgi:hypothetical protein